MKNLKKLIALVAVMAMMATTVAFAGSYSDVTESNMHYSAVETLSRLNLLKGYPDGTFGTDKDITRAEFAAVICRAMDQQDLAKTNTPFSDVGFDYWGSGYVKMAYDLGIINGFGDGTFGPDQNVTYEQAIKMIMCALGYEPAIRGNYPSGYLTEAAKAGVTRGIEGGVVGQPATRGLVALLMYKAIDTPLMDQVIWGVDGSTGQDQYTLLDGLNGRAYETLMSKYLGVTKLRGVVLTNAWNDLTGPKSNFRFGADSTVRFNITDNFNSSNSKYKGKYDNYNVIYYENETFRVGDSDADDMLGQAVVVYVLADTRYSYDTILSIVPDSNRNIMTTFNLSDYKGVADVASNNAEYYNISYLRNSSDRNPSTLKVNDGAPILFNNVRVDSTLADDALIEDLMVLGTIEKFGGKVTLLDNNNDGYADYVFIEQAETGVVEDVTRNRITWKSSGGSNLPAIPVDPTDDAKYVVITDADGKEIDVNDLEEFDVISVLQSKGKNVFFLKVIGDIVEGEITEIGESTSSADDHTYVVNGVEYKLAEGYYQDGALSIGAEGKFYIDEYGKVAAFQKSDVKGGLMYAWLLKVEANTGLGSNKLTAQLVTEFGEEIIVTFATNLIVDNCPKDGIFNTGSKAGSVTVKSVDNPDVKAELMDLENVLVKIKVVGTEIKTIEFAKDSTGKSELNAANIYDNIFLDVAADIDGSYSEKGQRMNIGGKNFNLEENIPVFFLGEGTAADPDKITSTSIKVRKIGSLIDDKTYDYVEIYKDEERASSSAAVIYGKPGVPFSNALAFVQSISKANNPDGVPVSRVSYYLGGELKSALTDEDFDTNLLAAGVGALLSLEDGVIVDAYPLFGIDVDKDSKDYTAASAFDFFALDGDDDKNEIAISAIVNVANNNVNLANVYMLNTNAEDKSSNPLYNDTVSFTGFAADINSTEPFSLRSVSNFYVFDRTRSGNAKYGEGVMGDADIIINQVKDGTKLNDEIKIALGSSATVYDVATDLAEIMSLFDWAIVRSYDGTPKEVVIVKSANTWNISKN